MTKTNKEGAPAYDWHAFQQPLEPDPESEGEARQAEGKTKDECETCGEGQDALVHQIDDSGNPTLEARQAVERGDTEI